MKASVSLFSVLALSSAAYGGHAYAAGPDCAALQAPNQKPDEDSVKRAERTWLVAEFRGDVDTVGCMLEPNYTEIRFDGEVRGKAHILEGAAKAKGSTAPIPTVVWTGIVVNGASATAYSVQDKHDMDGKPVKLFFTDTFIFHDGAWHPYFSVNAAAVAEMKIKD
ncbi:MAG TPA: nuclear transport factor 2 family protein [Gammaproteobacteria bacterium]|nr:nuclear transport factor 2 family protein [Gammaproteobacteria bacterium]